MKITYSPAPEHRLKCHESALPPGWYRGKVRGFTDCLFYKTSNSLYFFPVPTGNVDILHGGISQPHTPHVVDVVEVDVEMIVTERR